ncbi:hypothetical protein [Candidatus Nephthysia bennettiae]|uniref:Uncharacterized protein n=1 Tax=Candidatus Nephthysia bennettiae TaxID=3127016 RepID=A0A934K525_9BACT|nr:hypothetical protein [Candidatus Dormibacteraeota bacterium]
MSTLSRTEHAELAGIVKRNFRVAKAGIDEQKARVLADFEAAISHQWDPVELACEELIAEAKAAVDRINRRIEDEFVELGLPGEWAPNAGFGWRSRGQNAIPERRAELRRAAVTRAEALAQTAKLELAKQEAGILTSIASTALTSEAAQAFLKQVPSLEELMPPLQVEAPPQEAVKALLDKRQALSAKRAEAGRAGGRRSAKAKQSAALAEQVAERSKS